MKYRHRKRKNRPFSKAIIFGVVINLCSFFLFSFVVALIISAFRNPLALMGIGAFVSLSMTGALSGFFTSEYKGERGVIYALLCSVIFAVIILIAGLISSGGKLGSPSLFNLASYIVFTLVFAMLQKKKKRRRI